MLLVENIFIQLFNNNNNILCYYKYLTFIIIILKIIQNIKHIID